jgi:hypothetical protein
MIYRKCRQLKTFLLQTNSHVPFTQFSFLADFQGIIPLLSKETSSPNMEYRCLRVVNRPKRTTSANFFYSCKKCKALIGISKKNLLFAVTLLKENFLPSKSIQVQIQCRSNPGNRDNEQKRFMFAATVINIGDIDC